MLDIVIEDKGVAHGTMWRLDVDLEPLPRSFTKERYGIARECLGRLLVPHDQVLDGAKNMEHGRLAHAVVAKQQAVRAGAEFEVHEAAIVMSVEARQHQGPAPYMSRGAGATPLAMPQGCSRPRRFFAPAPGGAALALVLMAPSRGGEPNGSPVAP